MRRKILLTLVAASVLITHGCAGARRDADRDLEDDVPSVESTSIPSQSVETETIEGTYGPSEAYGPTTPAEESVVAETPAPTKPKLCLVLGPGYARGIAHAGVIEALARNQIPIHCIVGVEMGAVVGAFYAISGSVNTMQWQLFKVNKETLFNFPLIAFGAKRASGKEFNNFLKEAVGDRAVEGLQVEFAAVATQSSGAQSAVLKSGNLADALSASVALPGIFDSWRMKSGARLIGGGVSAPLPVEIARKLGGTFIVAVSVLPERGEPAGRSDELFERAFIPVLNLSSLQEEAADVVIRPDLRDASYDDFSQLGTLVAAGREKANELAADIKARWERSVEEHEAD